MATKEYTEIRKVVYLPNIDKYVSSWGYSQGIFDMKFTDNIFQAIDVSDVNFVTFFLDPDVVHIPVTFSAERASDTTQLPLAAFAAFSISLVPFDFLIHFLI